MKTINTLDFKGKRALVRVDFNVPLNKNFEVKDTTRIISAVPTIKYILDKGGAVILMSHMGRPMGKGYEKKFSLKHIISEIEKALLLPVKFAPDCIGDIAKKLSNDLNPGEVLLLENLRFYTHETKGDEKFSKALSNLGDIYVNDAFGTVHRAHSSTTIIAKYFKHKKCFGMLMEKELTSIKKIIQNPQKPFTLIIGGAKISSKIGIIKNLLPLLDNIIIGGGMIYTFIKAQNGNIGKSLVEDSYLTYAKNLIQEVKKNNINLYLPTDSIIADDFKNNANTKIVNTFEIDNEYMGLDIGPKAIDEYTQCILNSKTILWNGPMGVFEMDSFSKGTKTIGEAICKATKNGTFSLIGGGDSVAAINKFNLSQQVSYVSTGGGALLELIEGIKLPGVEAMNE